MNISLAAIIFISLAIFSKNAFAQEASIEQLTVKNAIDMALGMNVTLKRAEISKLDSDARLRIAGLETTYGASARTTLDRVNQDANLSGAVSGNLSYNSLPGTTADLSISPFGIGNDRGSIGISVRKPLTRGKGILSDKSNQVLNARSSLFIDSNNYFLATQNLTLNVLNAYYDAIKARQLVIEQENALTYVEQAAIYARKREEAGLGRGIDVSRAEVTVAQTKDQLNLQRASARAAMDNLMIAIGSGIGKYYDLVDPVPDKIDPLPSLDDAIKIAIANRVELATYDRQIKDQERDLLMAEDRMKNGLDATASFNSTRGNSGLLDVDSFDNGALRVGVELKIPLDKRSLKDERDITVRGLDILKKQKEFRIEQITDEVRGAYRSFESAGTSLQIFSQNLSQAQENLRIAERMVEEGEGDNRDVLDAQSGLTRVTSSIVSAKINLFLASVNVRYAMGEDLTKLGQL